MIRFDISFRYTVVISNRIISAASICIFIRTYLLNIDINNRRIASILYRYRVYGYFRYIESSLIQAC